MRASRRVNSSRVTQGLFSTRQLAPRASTRRSFAVGRDPKAARGVIDKEIDRLDWLDFRGVADFYAVGGAWR